MVEGWAWVYPSKVLPYHSNHYSSLWAVAILGDPLIPSINPIHPTPSCVWLHLCQMGHPWHCCSPKHVCCRKQSLDVLIWVLDIIQAVDDMNDCPRGLTLKATRVLFMHLLIGCVIIVVSMAVILEAKYDVVWIHIVHHHFLTNVRIHSISLYLDTWCNIICDLTVTLCCWIMTRVLLLEEMIKARRNDCW